MNEVILNWLPPAIKSWPSPSMSVLKTYLEKNKKKANVIYWNTILDDILKEYIFLEGDPTDEIGFLALFFAYLAKTNNDKSNIIRQEIILRSIKPQYRNNNSNYFKEHIDTLVCKLENKIRETLSQIDFSKCLIFGMSMNLYQWIPAIVIAKILKELHPDIKICIGGIGTKDAASVYLKNFHEFDYAIWGEGETPLLNLVNAIEKGTNLDEIPQIVYRNESNLCYSTNKKNIYLNLNQPIQINYSDYFSQTSVDYDKIGIPLEGSRGCHWLKCKFCFLNDGYRYRTKNPEVIVNEIKNNMEVYNIYKFQFLDNDIIGKDLSKFDKLLDLLIDIKREQPKFEIFLAEIVTKNLESHYIKKMSLAGFNCVQIGYESPSDSLLTKISKKNTFASNLLFIKWANLYKIRINGVNVLRGLLEETDDDILESINNLHFLRFTLDKNYFQHNISQLAIGKSSRYYKEIVDTEEYLNYYDIMSEFISNDLINREDRDTIFYSTKSKQNLYWDFFGKTENYYLDNKFEYRLIANNSKIIYNEFCNKEEIKSLEFEKSSMHWQILESCNKKVLSTSDLQLILNKDENLIDLNIKELIEEGLLYQSSNNQEIISVINTESITN